MPARLTLRALTALALAAGGLGLLGAPAHAQGRVAVSNPDGAAVVDPTYATTLTVTGSGFQSIRGGHGGIYVFFGTVSGRWRPSQGGASGSDYLYVPDSESRDNQGFQKYVAFPGSDTGGSANGGTIATDGTWSTTITVPGAVFSARGRDGTVQRVDCREVACGVITVGAHGVTNATNESFTPVTVASIEQEAAPAEPQQPSGAAPRTDVRTTAERPRGARAARTPPGPPALEVDRASAQAGHVLPFAASGLTPAAQVSVVLDDGVAAAGPFLVGADGRLAGVLTLPAELTAGTHELRLFGLDDAPGVSFAVRAAGAEAVAPAATDTPAPTEAAVGEVAGLVFVVVAAALLVAALLRLAMRRRQVRRAA